MLLTIAPIDWPGDGRIANSLSSAQWLHILIILTRNSLPRTLIITMDIYAISIDWTGLPFDNQWEFTCQINCAFGHLAVFSDPIANRHHRHRYYSSSPRRVRAQDRSINVFVETADGAVNLGPNDAYQKWWLAFWWYHARVAKSCRPGQQKVLKRNHNRLWFID